MALAETSLAKKALHATKSANKSNYYRIAQTADLGP
jgi:hypothetical protein